jgi:tripartite-type tricarboxylate transporter receptor subunit TctC
LLAGSAARADDYPNRPIRVVVGFSAGSGADITARVVGQRMGQILGQQIVVENKTGAGSSLAAEFVARAPRTATRCCWRRSPIPSMPR